jgi:two-component system, sensor histidine kinase YesM
MIFQEKNNFGFSPKKIYLKKIIFSYVFLIFLPVFFVGGIIYNYSINIIADETSKSVNDLLDQTSDIINDIITNTKSVFFQMALNSMTTELIKKPKEYFNTYEGIKNVLNVLDIYNNLTISNKYVDSFYIYSVNFNKVITSNNGTIPYDKIPFKRWITDKIDVNKQMEWIAVKDKDVFGDSDKYYYSFRGHFLKLAVPGKDMVLLNLNVDSINSKISQLKIKETGYVVVTDEKGKILFYRDKALLLDDLGKICNKDTIFSNNKGHYTDVMNGRKTMVVYTTIEQLGWKEIAFIPMASITGKIDFMKKVSLYVIFLSIIIAVLFSIFVSRKIYKPMDILLKGMKNVETGNLSFRISDKRKDEFGYLYMVFNSMLKKIDELLFDAYKLKLLNKDAELKALQAQINPHFLHNTFNSIYCMAKSYGFDEISRMIYKLSEYFRMGFDFNSGEIEIAEEINHVKLYVDIMSARYVGKFIIDFDINDDLYNCKTLKYLIQPLVENSFNHGMKGGKHKLDMAVSGRIEGNKVRFEVSDNGAGIDESKLQSIRRSLEKMSAESENFALCNINSRIKLFYGEEYGIEISSRVNEGTKVSIVIPVR